MNKGYFEKRALSVEDKAFNTSKKTFKKVLKIFKDSEKVVQAKIDEFYRNFAIENKITLAESKKLLNSKEFREWKSKINSYIKAIGREIKGNELELEVFAKRSQITRLDALLSEIKAEQDLMYSKQLRLFDNNMVDVYKDSYYHTIYSIQSEAKMYYPFTVVDSEVTKKILTYKNSGENFSKRIWGTHRKKLFEDVQTKIAQNLVTGEGNRELAKEVAKRYSVSKHNAERLIRTESNFYMNQAEIESYKETGVTEYMYLATLDDRTSLICKSLDGKVFKLSEAIAGINYPPLHAFCRSTTIPYYDDTKLEQRVMRNHNDKSVTREYMSYEEWEKRYI